MKTHKIIVIHYFKKNSSKPESIMSNYSNLRLDHSHVITIYNYVKHEIITITMYKL
jgi:hypothetical protein